MVLPEFHSIEESVHHFGLVLCEVCQEPVPLDDLELHCRSGHHLLCVHAYVDRIRMVSHPAGHGELFLHLSRVLCWDVPRVIRTFKYILLSMHRQLCAAALDFRIGAIRRVPRLPL